MKVMRGSVMTVMMLAMMGVQDTFGSRCPEGQVHLNGVGCDTCGQNQYYKSGQCLQCGNYMYNNGAFHIGYAPYGLTENIYGYCHRGNCPSGKYGSSPTDCTTCPAGYFQNYTHQTACTACVAGRYRTGGPGEDAVCKKCPIGYYNDEPGNPQMSCKECAAGYYTTETGQASCNTQITNCDPGKYLDLETDACVSCSQGKYTVKEYTVGKEDCNACENGKTTPNPNTSSYTLFDPFFYYQVKDTNAEQYYINTCYECPNLFGLVRHAVHVYENEEWTVKCQQCQYYEYYDENATHPDAGGRPQCQMCSLDVYGSYDSYQSCVGCTTGNAVYVYENEEWTVKCRHCQYYEYHDENATHPDAGGRPQCQMCSLDVYGTYDSYQSCVGCTTGYAVYVYENEEWTVKCQQCQYNEYYDENATHPDAGGRPQCQTCPYGTHGSIGTTEHSATQCTPNICPGNSALLDMGSYYQCGDCPEGTYSDYSQCLPCDDGKVHGMKQIYCKNYVCANGICSRRDFTNDPVGIGFNNSGSEIMQPYTLACGNGKDMVRRPPHHLTQLKDYDSISYPSLGTSWLRGYIMYSFRREYYEVLAFGAPTKLVSPFLFNTRFTNTYRKPHYESKCCSTITIYAKKFAYLVEPVKVSRYDYDKYRIYEDQIGVHGYDVACVLFDTNEPTYDTYLAEASRRGLILEANFSGQRTLEQELNDCAQRCVIRAASDMRIRWYLVENHTCYCSGAIPLLRDEYTKTDESFNNIKPSVSMSTCRSMKVVMKGERNFGNIIYTCDHDDIGDDMNTEVTPVRIFDRPNDLSNANTLNSISFTKYLCPKGKQWNGQECEACPAGYVKSTIGNDEACEQCPVGAAIEFDSDGVAIGCDTSTCYGNTVQSSACGDREKTYENGMAMVKKFVPLVYFDRCPSGQKQYTEEECGPERTVLSDASKPVGCYKEGNAYYFNTASGVANGGLGNFDAGITLLCRDEADCSCECAPGYTLVNGACEVCPSGTYKSSSGNGACEECPFGTVALLDGDGAATSCDASTCYHNTVQTSACYEHETTYASRTEMISYTPKIREDSSGNKQGTLCNGKGSDYTNPRRSGFGKTGMTADMCFAYCGTEVMPEGSNPSSSSAATFDEWLPGDGRNESNALSTPNSFYTSNSWCYCLENDCGPGHYAYFSDLSKSYWTAHTIEYAPRCPSGHREYREEECGPSRTVVSDKTKPVGCYKEDGAYYFNTLPIDDVENHGLGEHYGDVTLLCREEADDCSCGCAPGYTLVNGACEVCPPGTHKSSSGNGACEECPFGTVALLDGDGAPIGCDMSTCYNNTVRTCEAETIYASDDDMILSNSTFYGVTFTTYHPRCPSGQEEYSEEECGPARTVVNEYSKPAGCYKEGGSYYFNTATNVARSGLGNFDAGITLLCHNGADDCACGCAPGYTLVNGACEVCPEGTYKSSSGNGACEQCPLGSAVWLDGDGAPRGCDESVCLANTVPVLSCEHSTSYASVDDMILTSTETAWGWKITTYHPRCPDGQKAFTEEECGAKRTVVEDSSKPVGCYKEGGEYYFNTALNAARSGLGSPDASIELLCRDEADCTCECAAGHTLVDGACTICPDGHYKSGRGNGECDSVCPNGNARLPDASGCSESCDTGRGFTPNRCYERVRSYSSREKMISYTPIIRTDDNGNELGTKCDGKGNSYMKNRRSGFYRKGVTADLCFAYCGTEVRPAGLPPLSSDITTATFDEWMARYTDDRDDALSTPNAFYTMSSGLCYCVENECKDGQILTDDLVKLSDTRWSAYTIEYEPRCPNGQIEYAQEECGPTRTVVSNKTKPVGCYKENGDYYFNTLPIDKVENHGLGEDYGNVELVCKIEMNVVARTIASEGDASYYTIGHSKLADAHCNSGSQAEGKQSGFSSSGITNSTCFEYCKTGVRPAGSGVLGVTTFSGWGANTDRPGLDDVPHSFHYHSTRCYCNQNDCSTSYQGGKGGSYDAHGIVYNDGHDRCLDGSEELTRDECVKYSNGNFQDKNDPKAPKGCYKDGTMFYFNLVADGDYYYNGLGDREEYPGAELLCKEALQCNGGDEKCLCSPPLLISDDKQECLCNAANTVGNSSNCVCADDFELDTNGNCVACPDGQQSRGGSSCFTCYASDNKEILGDTCVCKANYEDDGSGVCVPCDGQISNAGESCRDCEQNEYYDNGACHPCGANKINSNGTCVCDAGFEEDDGGVCQPCANGLISVAGGECGCADPKKTLSYGFCQCDGDKYFVRDTNPPYHCVCDANYQEDSDGVCQPCEDNKVSDAGGQCRDCLQNEYYEDGFCVPCGDGEVLVNGTCQCDGLNHFVQDPSIVDYRYCVCKSNYQKDSNGDCQPCEDNQVSDAGGQCRDCLQNEYYEDGECVSCGAGKVLVDGACVCDVDNHFTEDVSSIGECVCAANYQKDSNGDCQPCEDNQVSEAGDQCRDCFQNEYYDNGVCVSCGVGQVVNADKNGCEAACDAGKVLDNGACVCDSAQHLVELSGACVCAANYQDDNGTCQACVNQTISVAGGTCQPCLDKQYYEGGACHECDSGYVVNTAQNGCRACDRGDYESNDACYDCGDNEYTLSDGSTQCLPCGENALSVAPHYECTCKETFIGSWDPSCDIELSYFCTVHPQMTGTFSDLNIAIVNHGGNSNVDVYVSGGDINTAPYYDFYTDASGTTRLTEMDVGNTYTFRRLGAATSHPFSIRKEGGTTRSGDGGITGSETMTVTFDSARCGNCRCPDNHAIVNGKCVCGGAEGTHAIVNDECVEVDCNGVPGGDSVIVNGVCASPKLSAIMSRMRGLNKFTVVTFDGVKGKGAAAAKESMKAFKNLFDDVFDSESMAERKEARVERRRFVKSQRRDFNADKNVSANFGRKKTAENFLQIPKKMLRATAGDDDVVYVANKKPNTNVCESVFEIFDDGMNYITPEYNAACNNDQKIFIECDGAKQQIATLTGEDTDGGNEYVGLNSSYYDRNIDDVNVVCYNTKINVQLAGSFTTENGDCAIGAGFNGTACDACDEGSTFSDEESNSACTECSTCDAGKVVSSACNATHDTVCVDCENDQYTSDGLTCSPCSSCDEGEVVSLACNATHDTVCVDCGIGNYTSDGLTCSQCSSCDEGKVVSSACTATHDTVCVDCENDQYTSDGLTCSQCSSCDAGEVVSSACNATHDTVCDYCPNGHYKLNDTTCSQCSSCDAGKVVLSACNATHDTVCGDLSCSENQYIVEDGCSACTVCEFYNSECTENANAVCGCAAGKGMVNGTCVECGEGTYNDVNGTLECQACTTCITGHTVDTACTPTTNTVCKDRCNVVNGDDTSCEYTCAGESSPRFASYNQIINRNSVCNINTEGWTLN